MIPRSVQTGLAWVRDLATHTVIGRLLAGAVAVKAAVLALRVATGDPALLTLVDGASTLALLIGGVGLLVQAWMAARRVLLWRVRRKLILSYVFIGFVPALLIVVFFFIAGLLLFFTVGAYMFESRVEAVVAEARATADAAAAELGAARDDGPSRRAARLAARIGALAGTHPAASAVVLPTSCAAADTAASAGGAWEGAAATPGATPLVAGPWRHAPVLQGLPAWVPCSGIARLTMVVHPGRVDVVARAVAPVTGRPALAVVVDIPIGDPEARALGAETGISPIGVLAVQDGPDGEPRILAPGDPSPRVRLGPFSVGAGADALAAGGLQGVSIAEAVDWATGGTRTVALGFVMDLGRVYSRLVRFGFAQVGDVSVGQVLVAGLAIVGGLFLVIQVAAFVMGLALARSVTGAVHELFVGTARVQRGDFRHRIHVGSEDQLGELAASFNSMTASVEDLLKQKAEKDRLEQELRIARGIQMSLLPQGPLERPGLALLGYCEPAREVGGDYYDFFAIDEDRCGLLIADVAGKGTSAALYMAELKGIVLSLSQAHHSPRQLLIEANRIVSRHLDSRSFITMTYGVLDRRAGTFTHARAGHCPLVYLPASAAADAPRVLTPDGMVLGLQIDDGRTFERLLEETTVPVLPGDLFLLYTDGVSEAMNVEGEFFGDGRLGAAFRAHAAAPFDDLGPRILADVRGFVGTAAPHDDMTLVMMKVLEIPVGRA